MSPHTSPGQGTPAPIYVLNIIWKTRYALLHICSITLDLPPATPRVWRGSSGESPPASRATARATVMAHMRWGSARACLRTVSAHAASRTSKLGGGRTNGGGIGTSARPGTASLRKQDLASALRVRRAVEALGAVAVEHRVCKQLSPSRVVLCKVGDIKHAVARRPRAGEVLEVGREPQAEVRHADSKQGRVGRARWRHAEVARARRRAVGAHAQQQPTRLDA